MDSLHKLCYQLHLMATSAKLSFQYIIEHVWLWWGAVLVINCGGLYGFANLVGHFLMMSADKWKYTKNHQCKRKIRIQNYISFFASGMPADGDFYPKIRRSYLYYRNPYTDKTFLYWDGLKEAIHQKDIRAELIVSFVYQTATFH